MKQWLLVWMASAVFVGQALAFHPQPGARGGETRAQDAAPDRPSGSIVWVAHRGGIVEGIPENTLAAFRHAIDAGADALEIDLRGTADGRIVIMHDETVDRTTDGRGLVSSRTLAELKSLDAGRGEPIPTYEEVLQLVAGTGVTLLLDIKESPTLDKARVVRLTESFDAALNVIVGARNLDDLRAFRALNPNLRTLGFIPTPDDAAAFVEAGVDIVRLWPDWIRADPERVQRIHRLGKPVWTTAGDASREQLHALIALGVNGILSDRPEVMSDGRREVDAARKDEVVPGCEVCEMLPVESAYRDGPIKSRDLLVHESDHWKILVFADDQRYLGRLLVMLKRHAASLADLTATEWDDLQVVIALMEDAERRAFGAANFNWTCLMNNAFQETPPQPHVHLHFRPRYAAPVSFADVVFTDEEFGHHYDRDREAPTKAMALKIAAALRETLERER